MPYNERIRAKTLIAETSSHEHNLRGPSTSLLDITITEIKRLLDRQTKVFCPKLFYVKKWGEWLLPAAKKLFPLSISSQHKQMQWLMRPRRAQMRTYDV